MPILLYDPTITLSKETYYTDAMNQKYMSYSQYGDFLECEAMAMAKIYGGWSEPGTVDMLVGSYIHSWNEGTLDDFIANTPQMFKKAKEGQKPEPYAEFRFAEKMIKALESDEFIMFILLGQKEVIATAEFAGCLWKVRLDSVNEQQGWFCDLKSTRNMHEKHWLVKRHAWGSFVEAYGYVGQVAIYGEVYKRFKNLTEPLEPLMPVVTKEDPPNTAVIRFDRESLEEALFDIETNMPRILSVKNFEEAPRRCEKCRYCRETRKKSNVIHFRDLIV
jgi:hypothetical protein